MAKLKLEIGETYNVALKFAKGKFYESTIPGLDGSLMFTLQDGDVIFLPETADEMFAERNIGAGEPFSIARKKTKQKGEYFEIHKLSDAQEPALDPSRYPDEQGRVTTLETKLVASIDQAQQRKTANPSKLPPPVAAPVVQKTPQQQSNATTAGATRASSEMGGAMIAAIDALAIAAEYATARGLTLEINADVVCRVAATVYNKFCKSPLYPERGAAAAGGGSWRQ